MKRTLAWLIGGLMAVSGWTAEQGEKPMPKMPSEVTLTSGRVLRGVSVIRWESNRVVLKHTGGADPIAFSLIKSVTRDELRTMQKGGEADAAKMAQAKRKLAELEAGRAAAAQEAAELDKRLDEARERASRNGQLMEGQTTEQARMALGTYPQRQNEYASGTQIQAIYYMTDNSTVYYVYFTDGRVTSWQKSNRR